jgi:glucose/arabinose dehydrogenase
LAGALLVCGALATACDKKTPSPPDVTPGQPENVTGAERIGWQQTASGRTEVATFRFAIYVDNVRSELPGADCQGPVSRISDFFLCSAPLPPLSPGPHTIELSTFVVDGALLESPRSAPLQVIKSAPTSAPGDPGGSPVRWQDGLGVTTADGLQVRVHRRADGLVRPTDLAFLPDGRILVAEEAGQVRVVTPDRGLLDEPAVSLSRIHGGSVALRSLGVDPDFQATRAVYAVYTTERQNGSRVFTIARFTELSNTLAAEIPLLDGVAASTAGAASIRTAADGKVFVALDDGGDPRSAGDLASPNGKLLRLNPDGTTPPDQAGLTPTYTGDLRAPAGFDWQPGSRLLWIADRRSSSLATLTAVGHLEDRLKRGTRVAAYSLPRDTVPSSAAFLRNASIPAVRNNLLIASESGRHLLRVRFDARGTGVLGTERLLQDVVGPIRVVAVAPDGELYIATDAAVAQITIAE